MSKKETATKWAIMELINRYKEKGLGFDDIADMMKRGKGFKTIKSRVTISKILKTLAKEGCITKDIDTRKYTLTAKGQQTAKMFYLIDQLTSSSFIDSESPSDWQSMLVQLFINSEGDISKFKYSDVLTELAYNRLRKNIRESWLDDMIKVAKEKGLDIRDLDNLDELFKGVNAIIIVDIFDPRAWLNRLHQEVTREKLLETFQEAEEGERSAQV